jgi:tRNA pseudouridine55 synthase
MSKSTKESIHGVLLLDKGVGLSSFDVVRRIRWILKAKKVGHAGTLDPFATGLLPICVGESTKAVHQLVEGTKTYEAVIRLGQETDTLDKDGEVISEHSWDHVSLEDFRDVVAEFVGDIEQVPPLYSALKIKGKRLYEYARSGEKVEIPSRVVHVEKIEVVKQEGPHVSFQVVCGKGTYIRAIARDVGRKLGCGAHLRELRRTQVGNLSVSNAITLSENLSSEDLLEGLISSEQALSHLPEMTLDEGLSARVQHGQRIPLHELPGGVLGGPTRALGPEGKLLALVVEKEGCLSVIRGFVHPW